MRLREFALWCACREDGAWPRLPASRRHLPAVWRAYGELDGLGLVRCTGDVRGDRTQYLATGRGRMVMAAMAGPDLP